MRILHLFPRDLWDRKMSLARQLYAEALAQVPGVDVRTWGPGWDRYNCGMTLTRNLERVGWKPDVVLIYRVGPTRGVPEIDAVRVVTLNEAFDHDWTMEIIKPAAPHVIVFHHSADVERWRHLEAQGVRLFHIPHCADTRFFDGAETNDRPIPCLLTGKLDADLYPLRTRFAHLIRSSRIPGLIRPHPGYGVQSHDDARRQYWEYAHQLRRSKIALVCSSRYRYPLAKYVEAMAAGCLVIGDSPDDPEYTDLLMKYGVVVPPDCGEDEFVRAVCRVLEHYDTQFSHRARAGQSFVRSRLSSSRYAAELSAIIKGQKLP